MYSRRRVYKLRSVKLELTHRCNLRCKHCSSVAYRSCVREMSRKDCARILNEAAGMKVREIDISGGEPLLWPHLEEIASLISRLGFEAGIFTSGCVRGFADKARGLRRRGIVHMAFSLFAAKPNTHDDVTRVPGSFARTTRALQEAHELGFRTEVHFVPFATNYSELTPLAHLAVGMGASRVSVLRFVPQGRGTRIRDHVLDRTQNRELGLAIQHLRGEKIEVRTGSPYNFLFLNKQPECGAGIDRLTIGPDLRIYPCDAFKGTLAERVASTQKLSSLTDASLAECWGSSPYLKAVRDCIGAGPAGRCSSCRSHPICRSGCLAQKLIANGTLTNGPDPLCLLS